MKANGFSNKCKGIPQPEMEAEVFNKPRQLVEFADEDPYYVMEHVFTSTQWAFINEEVLDWLLVGLSSQHVAYDNAGYRHRLICFHDDVRFLIEALLIIHLQEIQNSGKKEPVLYYEVQLLSQVQMANPTQVIAGFFEKYTTVYIIRELNDWLEVGISHAGPWRDNMTGPLHVLQTYRNVLCLIKVANLLLKEMESGQKQ